MPTLNVRLDVWDCAESYAIHMFLAHRLMITFTSNLKLIISFLVLHILFSFIFTSCYLLLPNRSTLLILHTVPRLANEHSADVATNLEEQDCKWNDVSPKLCFTIIFHFRLKPHAWFLLSV